MATTPSSKNEIPATTRAKGKVPSPVPWGLRAVLTGVLGSQMTRWFLEPQFCGGKPGWKWASVACSKMSLVTLHTVTETLGDEA